MPTSSQRSIIWHSQPIFALNSGNTNAVGKVTRSRESIYVHQNRKQSSLSTKTTASHQIKVFTNDLQKIPRTKRCTRQSLIIYFLLLTFLVLSILTLAIVLPLVLRSQTLTTTVTTTIITTTTAPNCVLPYVQASPGNCVNILLDFNNCGAVGNICPSSTTSCSAGVCSTVPTVQLTNPTSIWTGGINGPADDNIFNVTLPFPVTIYSTTTSYIQLTVNGVICLSYCTSAWMETSLPSTSFGATVFPYWDDLYIYGKTWQGIYYEVQGVAPNRMLVFEYYTSQYGSVNEFYHFQVVFYETSPGIVQFIYFDVYDTGASCTVGVQASSSGSSLLSSFDAANSVQPNMILTFNTNTGTITASTIG